MTEEKNRRKLPTFDGIGVLADVIANVVVFILFIIVFGVLVLIFDTCN